MAGSSSCLESLAMPLNQQQFGSSILDTGGRLVLPGRLALHPASGRMRDV
jgi:hypothetical protein